MSHDMPAKRTLEATSYTRREVARLLQKDFMQNNREQMPDKYKITVRFDPNHGAVVSCGEWKDPTKEEEFHNAF